MGKGDDGVKPLRSSSECMICRAPASFHFSKQFGGLLDLQAVEYWRCRACGFTYSKTHFDMPDEAWGLLNQRYHAGYQGTAENLDDRNWRARLVAQRQVIAHLAAAGAIPAGRPWLDWGAGDGSLSKLLEGDGLELRNHDKFMSHPGFLGENDLVPGGFDFAVTTSVFEHVMDVDILDDISGLVSPVGVLGVHTMVSEEVARDPDWFYLLPVHVSFFTNKSMDHLFHKWKYHSSLYHIPSRLWFFFRDAKVQVRALAEAGNASAGSEVFFAKEAAFADYWKS